MNRSLASYKLGAFVVLCTFVISSGVCAASWTDFGSAQFAGITVDKPLQVNVLDYTVTVDPHPTMTVEGKTYQVNWIQSFYVVSGTGGGSFTASNGSGNTGWTWDSKNSGGGQISGWTGQGNDRVFPGQSKSFHFSTFDPKGNPVVAGFHVAYMDGKDQVTAWYKGAKLPQAFVPEPSSIVCLGVAMAGLSGLVVRRRRRS